MSIHASTLLTRSPGALLSRVSQLSKLYRDHSLLFALSSNTDAADLSHLVDGLTSFSSQAVGCLSAPLPGYDGHGLIACSLAVFDRGRVVPFRSTIPGKEATQVGRWHAFRKKDDVSRDTEGESLTGKVDWEDVWDRNTKGNTLPQELQALRYALYHQCRSRSSVEQIAVQAQLTQSFTSPIARLKVSQTHFLPSQTPPRLV